jgi:O-antigen/teichoic acid export membrane protein
MNDSKSTFFRQSGWMVLSTAIFGVFVAAVHPVTSALLPAGEYGVFVTMLRALLIMAIPAAGVQTVFAQEAAGAISDPLRKQLAAATRAIFKAIFILWLIFAGAAAIFQQQIVQTMQMANPMTLWMTLGAILMVLWLPVAQGLLQGIQNFFWFGMSMIFHGVGRFVGIVAAVWLLHGFAASAMAGVLAGAAAAVLICLWTSRDLLKIPPGEFAWRNWFSRVVPLTLGAAPPVILMNADMLAVQSHFSREVTAFYAAPATLGTALVTFTTPLAAVMFPKIVRSMAQAGKSNALLYALSGASALAFGSALLCTIFPELPLRIMFFRKLEFLKAAPLVPWALWGMVPLSLGCVLVNNLMARGRFKFVPWAALAAAVYCVLLFVYVRSADVQDPLASFKRIFQLLGCFNLIFLVIAIVFTVRDAQPVKAGSGKLPKP